MKILIAEDQAVSRAKMAKALEDIGKIEIFETGKDALEAFGKASEENQPFDLMILDVSMPEMGGIELLTKVRKLETLKKISKESQVKVIMLTSYADKETVVSCYVAGCNDYAVKPFKKSVIIQKMGKMGFDLNRNSVTENEFSMAQMVSDAIDGFKNGKVELPSLPYIVQELQDMMNTPNVAISEMARLIEQDTAISINLIRAANSPFYGGIQKIQDVRMAINRLGLDKTRGLVSAIANKGLYETKNSSIKPLMDKLLRHSFAVAYLSGQIAKDVPSVASEKAFVKGLIHDVGATLLIKNIDEMIDKKKVVFDLNDLVDSLFEVHASFGAVLFKTWNFGKDFVDIASLHEWNQFNEQTDKELLIVNLADLLSDKIGYGFFNREEFELSDIQSAGFLGLDVAVLSMICEKAAKEIVESMKAFVNV